MHAVKFVDGSDTQIEGLAIPFGGPLSGKDFHGEDFGPDTDLALDLYPAGRPIMYHHGLNKDLGAAVQGRQTTHRVDDEGVWAQGELDKSAKYHATVARMVRDGKLFFSSGAIPHLVKTNDAGHIERWPWNELSLTPTPANPEARVYAVKAADHLEHLTAAGIDVPTAITNAVGSESEPFAVHAERVTAQVADFFDRVESRYGARIKSGRVLSAANRAEIAEVIDAIDRLGERRARLAELLAHSDPATVEAAATSLAEAKALEAEYLRLQSRLLGVPV